MKRIFLQSFILFFFSLAGIAQVTFILESIPDYTPPADLIFIAGNFTGWNPGNPAYVCEKNSENKWSITLGAQPEGTVVEYKFTRGSWETVEKGANDEELNNRTFTFGNDSVVYCTILNWADNDGSGGGSTAAENVSVMDEDFFMPQLNRTRRIWVYLPPGYHESTKRYPVIYMHDGQNLFDEQTSFAGEWEVDETLNGLSDMGYQVPIVVGIDNGGSYRIDEYTPWINPHYGGGQGDEYIRFIVETLKPYIDEIYRTLPAQQNTGLMGSSLGGLISFYGAMNYQAVFGKAGPFSPSYWYSDSIWSFTEGTPKQHSVQFYQYVGEFEGEDMQADMLLIETKLKELGFSETDIVSKVIPNGNHNEALWRQEFAEAYLWLFGSFANDIDENETITPLLISPNPVNDFLNLPQLANQTINSLYFADSSGRKVKLPDSHLQPLNVSSLPPGIYVIRLKSGKQNYSGRFLKL